MATYSNQHWLLSHIRNSFISTDDTGMCETVMVSDDLPKHFLRRFQAANTTPLINAQQQLKSNGMNGSAGGINSKNLHHNVDQPLQEVDFVCYPGLDQSDEEDIDLSTQSFDIQMYPEVGAHRFRSNTAQKLEKMDIARRKAARTKCVNYDDDIMGPERNDLFVRKEVVLQQRQQVGDKNKSSCGAENGNELVQDKLPEVKLEQSTAGFLIKSKLTLQLANSPKQTQNKFMEYARFDGTSQTGMQTKRINVFLSMLPEKDRNYPIKICVVASAKILEVIGLVCYKATIQFPAIPLKSIRHYALYMTEDNDDMEDFPPLDNREPCSKFGFSHLTLAERRPLAPVTRIDYHQNNNSSNNMTTKSMTSDDDKVRYAASTALQSFDLNGSNVDADANNSTNDADSLLGNYEERMLSHNEMLEAPMYRIYRLQMIDKRFFKTEVTLGISGERMEIDQHKNAKFWTKQKAVTHSIDAIAFCEIVERRNLKAILRIWLKSSSSSASSSSAAANVALLAEAKSSTLTIVGSGNVSSNVGPPHSPTSPGHYPTLASPFSFFTSSSSAPTSGHTHHIRFKHYDFEADLHTADHILNKLNCILDVRSSEVRREFLLMRERKLEKSQAKKQLKVF